MHSQNKVHGNLRPEYLGYDETNDNYMLMENLKD